MLLKGCLITLCLFFVGVFSQRNNRCEPYNYCEGHKFPSRIELKSRVVFCDQVPNPKESCCLDQAKHMVCYGITVDGGKLNYDIENYARTTDFTELCARMLKVQDKEIGTHSSALEGDGMGGNLVWLNDEWTEVEPGNKHIKHLACEYKED